MDHTLGTTGEVGERFSAPVHSDPGASYTIGIVSLSKGKAAGACR